MSYKDKIEKAFAEGALISINNMRLEQIVKLHKTENIIYKIEDGKCVAVGYEGIDYDECPACGCRDGNHAQECFIYYSAGYGKRCKPWVFGIAKESSEPERFIDVNTAML